MPTNVRKVYGNYIDQDDFAVKNGQVVFQTDRSSYAKVLLHDLPLDQHLHSVLTRPRITLGPWKPMVKRARRYKEGLVEEYETSCDWCGCWCREGYCDDCKFLVTNFGPRILRELDMRHVWYYNVECEYDREGFVEDSWLQVHLKSGKTVYYSEY